MLTVKEAAELLGVSSAAIYKRIDRGRLKYYKDADGVLVLSKADLESWKPRRAGRKRIG